MCSPVLCSRCGAPHEWNPYFDPPVCPKCVREDD